MSGEKPEGHLEHLRRLELEAVLPWFKPGMRVLEIGGGSGYQASRLAAHGCDVVSIDLPDRRTAFKRFYPVQEYDGRHFPVDNAHFDAVYSSNVLEHVPHLPVLLAEVRRVLKPDGFAIHILPTASWRFWTSVCHYGFVVKRLVGSRQSRDSAEPTIRDGLQRCGIGHALRVALLGPFLAHGEYPNALAELYYFSRCRWLRTFKANGFEVTRFDKNGLFYTGCSLLPRMSERIRRGLSRVLGSSCHIFVMRARERAGAPAIMAAAENGAAC